jgi:hypothetical protein
MEEEEGAPREGVLKEGSQVKCHASLIYKINN